MNPEQGLMVALAIILVPLAIGYIRNAYMAAMLITANIGMFIFSVFVVPLVGQGLVLENLAFNPQMFLEGRVHMLLTSMFMHLQPMHLIFNLVFLILWGPMLEMRIGARRLLLVYLLTGASAGLLYCVIYWDSYRFALGASGALFGFAGCFVALYPQERMSVILMFIPLRNVKGYVIIMFMLGIELFLYLGYSGSNIAHEAHLGGLAGGLALGAFMARYWPPSGKPRQIVLSVDALVPLAVNQDMGDMLHRISTSREPEIIKAWTEGFLERAECPACGKSLGDNDPWRALQGRMGCSCGWSNK